MVYLCKDLEKIGGLMGTHLIGDICLLLEEFVVVTQFMIFPIEPLGLAEKLMASPSSTKGKIVRLDTFQTSGGKHNCLLLPVVQQLKSKNPCMYPFHNKPEKKKR